MLINECEMASMQTAGAEVVPGGGRHCDGYRLPNPVPQQAALSHAAHLHVPPQLGVVSGGGGCAETRST